MGIPLFNMMPLNPALLTQDRLVHFAMGNTVTCFSICKESSLGPSSYTSDG